MDSERWNRVRQLFDASADLRGAERDAYLTGECGGDDVLRREVESLLDAELNASDRMQQAIGAALDGDALREDDAAREVAPSRIGSRIGPYEVLSHLGEGGMGTVYLAQRSDEVFELRVAIKVVRGGLDSARLLARFHTERHILSKLDHPNIARVLDGGTTHDGLPYLVMEYVEGRPLDLYSAGHEVPLRDRLRLFQDLCGAVDYAHQQLVVHRDLKPTNVLVTDQGVPKLLDFGIAKLLDRGPGEPPLTVADARVLTPDYASPEQVRGETVTTATDVYGLGILLYELIAGRHPFREPSMTPIDLERAILDTDPERPSQAVMRHADEPRRLRRELEGDLDSIALQALEKDPARRYRSVADLSSDIGRFLDGLPVRARRATFTYRAGKFIRRHRVAVGLAAALVVILVSAAVISTTAFLRADRLRREAETQRATVEEINDFMRKMFAAASPQKSQSKADITALDLLGSAAERIEAELGDRPDVAAMLENEIARRYFDLGELEVAEHLHRQSLESHRRAGRESTADGVTALIYLGQVVGERGRSDEALVILQDAVERAAQLDERFLDIDAEARRALAQELARRGDLEEAESLLLALLDDLDARGQRGDVDVSAERFGIANDLGILYQRLGKYAEAERWVLRALDEARRSLGEEHTTVGEYWGNLAYVQNRLGRPADAVVSARRAVEIHEKVFKPDHLQLATSRVGLADALSSTNQIDEAEQHYFQVFEVYRAVYGESHHRVGTVRHNMAMMFFNQGEYERAIPGLMEAAEIYAASFGEDHEYTAIALHNVARAQRRAGHIAEAERLGREVLDTRVRVLGEEHPDVGRSKLLLGRILLERGETAAARPLLASAVQILEARFEAGSVVRLEAEIELGRCLTGLSEYGAAEDVLLPAHAASESTGGRVRRESGEALVRLYEAWGKPEAAAAVVRP